MDIKPKNLLLVMSAIIVTSLMTALAPTLAQGGTPSSENGLYIINSLMLGLLSVLAMLVIVGIAMRDAGVSRSGPAAYRVLTFIGAAALAILVTWVSGYGIEHGVENGGLLAPVEQWFFWQPAWSLNASGALVAMEQEGQIAAPGFDFLFSSLVAVVPVMIALAAVSGRIRQTSLMIVVAVLAGVYFPLVRGWVWGDGYLAALGFVDIAGAASLHVVGGVTALTGTLMLGLKPPQDESLPPSAAGAALGSLLLWIGLLAVFMGLVGGVGSIGLGGAIDNLGLALVHAQLSAAAAVLAALILSSIMLGRADELLVINAAIGGLVAISADPVSAGLFFTLFIGAIAGCLVTLGMLGLKDAGAQDASGVISAHLLCGIWGVLIAALYSENASLMGQIGGLGMIVAVSALASSLIWLFVQVTFGFALPTTKRRPLRWPARHHKSTGKG
jgi:ammonium transporter, Amt family